MSYITNIVPLSPFPVWISIFISDTSDFEASRERDSLCAYRIVNFHPKEWTVRAIRIREKILITEVYTAYSSVCIRNFKIKE
jgi:hypothetical protein